MNTQGRSWVGETYLLGHTSAALHRLLVQGQMVNPFTRRVFEDAGMAAGMRVLDVGCGPGDVSLIAAALVGETGSVLGIDGSIEALQLARSRAQEASLTQISFRTGDLLRAGGDLATGMKLYGTLLGAGLPAPHLRYEAAVGAGPDWVGYEWWAETVRTFLPLIRQFGLATKEEIDIETLAERLREETISREGVARGPALVSAWVHKS